MAYKLTWLADVLRAAGLTVVEEGNWQDRGRAEMGTVQGVLCHHTGGPMKGDTPSLSLVINGRPDLAGPLSQLFLARSGAWHVLAAGRCNHAGAGNWHGVTAGNSDLIGIEAENAGTDADPWPPAQYESYARGVAAILSRLGASSDMVAGHREYALPKGRKIDPLFDMDDFRREVARFMQGHGEFAGPPRATSAANEMLRRGATGESVRQLQELLKVGVDGDFGPATEIAVRKFQEAQHLVADGLVGPATWQALGV